VLKAFVRFIARMREGKEPESRKFAFFANGIKKLA
jgi:hypothetical protein